MIQSGGWNRLRTPDEHTKLARMAVDIPRAADHAFGINVSKMRVIIPSEVRAELKAIASAVASRAQAAYRQTGNSRPGQGTLGGMGGGGGAGQGGATGTGTSGETGAAGTSADTNGAGESDQLVPWRVIYDVLHGELAKEPDLLQQLLDALSDALDGRTRGAAKGSRSA